MYPAGLQGQFDHHSTNNSLFQGKTLPLLAIHRCDRVVDGQLHILELD